MVTSSHDYTLNTHELFVITDALEAHKRSIEKQLAKALEEGNDVAIHMLWSDRQQTVDLHDMFNEPILQDASEWDFSDDDDIDFEEPEEDADDVLDAIDMDDWIKF